MIRKVKHKLREWSYDFVDLFGLPLRFKGREGDVQIICFHGICEDHHQLINGRFMHLSRFRKLLSALKQEFHILSYDEFVGGHRNPDKLNILITFDDGYRNFITLAFPVLKALEMPVVLFVNDPDEKANWPDLLDIAEAYLKDADAVIRQLLPPDAPKENTAWRGWLMGRHRPFIVSFTRQLSTVLPTQLLTEYAVFHELLSDEELMEIHRSGFVKLGNHGGNHLNYPVISETEQKEDLQRVTDRLQKIGCADQPFAFPFGNHNAETARRLESWGYKELFVLDKPALPQLHERIVVHPKFSNGNQLRYIFRGYF